MTTVVLLGYVKGITNNFVVLRVNSMKGAYCDLTVDKEEFPGAEVDHEIVVTITQKEAKESNET